MPALSEILTMLMAQQGLSDNELAIRAGVPQPTVSRLRNGGTPDPRDSTLRPLAEYFGLSIPQLRGYLPLPTDKVKVSANDQIVEVSAEALQLVMAMESLPSEERGALQTLIDALSKPKTKDQLKKAG